MMSVIKWVESKAGLLRQEYLKLRYEGMERDEIRKAYFKGNVRLFRDQLIDWELLSLDSEWEALRKMGKSVVAIELTKEQYLQRRLKGETRTKIARSLGVSNQRFYDLLKSWGIRELDAEERELELLAPVKQKKDANQRVAETIEKKVEARSATQPDDKQWSAEVVSELERTEAGEDILKRMEQRAAAQEKELTSLQAAVELWKNDAERKGEHIADLEAEIERFGQLSTQQSLEIARLESNKADANHYREAAESTLEYAKTLEAEREVLLRTIEQAAVKDVNMITLQVPIMPVLIAMQERTRIYDALEALGHGIEGAEINRQLVMSELFELLQRVVNFVTADLTELHPGRDATSHIHDFFKFYNEQHINELSLNIQKAV